MWCRSPLKCRKRKVREIQESRTPGGNQKWKNKGKQTLKRAKDRRKWDWCVTCFGREKEEWRIGRRFTSLPRYKLWFQCNVVNFSSMLSGLQYSAFCNSVNYVEVHNYFLMSSLVNWLFVINRSNVATASHPYKCRKRESILLKYPYLLVIIRKSLLLPWYACLKIFFPFCVEYGCGIINSVQSFHKLIEKNAIWSSVSQWSHVVVGSVNKTCNSE